MEKSSVNKAKISKSAYLYTYNRTRFFKLYKSLGIHLWITVSKNQYYFLNITFKLIINFYEKSQKFGLFLLI